jgi:protein-disulfide isomerase
MGRKRSGSGKKGLGVGVSGIAGVGRRVGGGARRKRFSLIGLLATTALLALVLVYVRFINAQPSVAESAEIAETQVARASTVADPVPPPAYTSEEFTAFIDSLRKNFHVQPCCAMPLEACASRKPECAIATRLLSFTAWIDSISRGAPGAVKERLAGALQDRYTSFVDTERYAADTSGWPVIGDPNARTTVVMYFSGTCPLCKTNFRDLHAALTTGPLRGKAKIVAKPFGTGLANRALTTAHVMGRFADFKLELAKVSGRIDENALISAAEQLLFFDTQRFRALLENPDVINRTQASTQEGNANNVTLVPTYLISGRRYNSLYDPHWIIDAIEYIHDQETPRRTR